MFSVSRNFRFSLFRVDSGKISYNDKRETTSSNNKYSYIKHLSESNTLHVYYHKCELKLVNNVTSSIRFFQESIHEENDFVSKFCIHIIPEPRSYRH